MLLSGVCIHRPLARRAGGQNKTRAPQRPTGESRGDRTRTCGLLVPNQARYQLRNTSARIPLYPLRPQTSRLCSVPLHILGVLGCETGLRRRLNPAIMESIHRAGKPGAQQTGRRLCAKRGGTQAPGRKTPKKRRAGTCSGTPFPKRRKEKEEWMKKFVCFPADSAPGPCSRGFLIWNNYRIPNRCDKKVTELSRNYERTGNSL